MVQKPGIIAAIIATVVIYGVFLVTPAFLPEGRGPGFFENTSNPIDITPARWVFGVVWSTIFIYQFIWLVYGLTTLCRRSEGGYLYFTPPYMPVTLYVFFSLSCLILVVWYFFAVMDSTVGRAVSSVLLYLSTFMLYIALYFSFKALANSKEELRNQNKDIEVRLVIGLVQNGLAEFATWVSLASMINLDIVLVNDADFNVQNAGSVILACVGLDVIVWSVLDNFYLQKYTQYVVTPYPVLLVALSGILQRQWNPDNRNSYITIALLVLAVVATILKIALLIVRHVRGSREQNQPPEKMPINKIQA